MESGNIPIPCLNSPGQESRNIYSESKAPWLMQDSNKLTLTNLKPMSQTTKLSCLCERTSLKNPKSRYCQLSSKEGIQEITNVGEADSCEWLKSINGKANFVQEYYYGDLRGCEFYGHDKMGRTAEVIMFCGNCTNGAICKDKSGCIRSVSYGITNCRVIVDLALSCGQPGLRIFQGFTAGIHPKAWEVVYSGIT